MGEWGLGAPGAFKVVQLGGRIEGSDFLSFPGADAEPHANDKGVDGVCHCSPDPYSDDRLKEQGQGDCKADPEGHRNSADDHRREGITGAPHRPRRLPDVSAHL